MKFAKVLGKAVEDVPVEFQQQFLQYKLLKKKIKSIPVQQQEPATDAAACTSNAEAGESGVSKLSEKEKEFLVALNTDLDKFNSFFMEKEEMAVIKMQSLTDAVKAARSQEELQKQKAAIVDFHGEVVLLLHWSMLNYAAVAKILKKHDKRSGVLLRAPCLANVLNQPFQSTNLMSRLVKEAEALVQKVFATEHASYPDAAAAATAAAPQDEQHPEGGAESSGAAHGNGYEHDEHCGGSDDECKTQYHCPSEAPLAKCTKMALETWASLTRGASTPSTLLTAVPAAPAAEQQQQLQLGAGQPTTSSKANNSAEKPSKPPGSGGKRRSSGGHGDGSSERSPKRSARS